MSACRFWMEIHPILAQQEKKQPEKTQQSSKIQLNNQTNQKCHKNHPLLFWNRFSFQRFWCLLNSQAPCGIGASQELLKQGFLGPNHFWRLFDRHRKTDMLPNIFLADMAIDLLESEVCWKTLWKSPQHQRLRRPRILNRVQNTHRRAIKTIQNSSKKPSENPWTRKSPNQKNSQNFWRNFETRTRPSSGPKLVLDKCRPSVNLVGKTYDLLIINYINYKPYGIV